MHRVRRVIVLLLVLLNSASAAFAVPPVLDKRHPATRVCGTDETGAKVAAPDRAVIEKWIRDNQIAANGVIPVNFHVIYGSSGEGNVPESQLDAQIAVLNSTFAGRGYDNGAQTGDNTGYTFLKNSVTRTQSQAWFTMTPNSFNERNAKRALTVNPQGSLNLYTCKPGQGILGWATFPWALGGNPSNDGIVVHYGSLPGGSLSPYNRGGTATHEVGHWVGLYHTFQSGCHSDASCSSNGDLVCDTPAEGTPTSGCPTGKNTCSAGGNDPIHNYMDYSIDACYTQFTSGQDVRADFMMATYRPQIGEATVTAAEHAGTAIESQAGSQATLRVSPNPFNPTTTLEFSLARAGRVALRVYDVTGREVAALVDGERDAGQHRAVFTGEGLASGIYMAVLRSAGVVTSQRLVLLK